MIVDIFYNDFFYLKLSIIIIICFFIVQIIFFIKNKNLFLIILFFYLLYIFVDYLYMSKYFVYDLNLSNEFVFLKNISVIIYFFLLSLFIFLFKNLIFFEKIKPTKIFDFINKSFILFLLILVSLVIIRNSWISDDAYITFRTLDNFLNGYGLRWNISERVQTFTNPLWLFVNIIPYIFYKNIFITSIILSIFISFASIFFVN